MTAISVIGISHRTAGVELRERIALDRDQAISLLHTVRDEGIVAEAVVLSTCNRTEIYYVPDGDAEPATHLLAHVGQIKGIDPPDPADFYRYHGMDAVDHLFRVACSLDSQIVGETEVTAQVKDAYAAACEARTARFLLHKLMHAAFRTAKRVQTDTRLTEGTASVAQAAVDLAAQLFDTLAGRTVLLIGAGQTAETAAEALIRAGADRLIVANRTPAAARDLAGRLRSRTAVPAPAERPPHGRRRVRCPALAILQGRECDIKTSDQPAGGLIVDAIDLASLPDRLGEADLIVSSTGSPEPVLTRDTHAAALARAARTVLIVDIAVPRDVDPALAEVGDVFLYNIDDLDALVETNLQRRRREVPAATAIVAAEVDQFARWLGSLDAVPTIKLLTRRAEQLAAAEADRYGRKFSDADRRKLERFAKSLARKILHDPVTFLRSLSDDEPSSDRLAAIDLLRQAFSLPPGDDPDPRREE